MRCPFLPTLRLSAAARRTLAAAAASPFLLVPAQLPAKTPGHTYCFHGTCHRVKTLEETRSLVGQTMPMQASFYDDAGKDGYNPSNRTSSGEYFRSGQPDNAASPIFPDGTKLLVWHPRSLKAIVIRVNNAGPYWGRRLLDLSRGGAERLGFTHSGTSTVHVKVLEAPTQAEATYRRNRTYAPVPGYIGSFASIDEALLDAGRRLALNFEPPSVQVASLGEILAKLGPLTSALHDAGDTLPALATIGQSPALETPAELSHEAPIVVALLPVPAPQTAAASKPITLAAVAPTPSAKHGPAATVRVAIATPRERAGKAAPPKATSDRIAQSSAEKFERRAKVAQRNEDEETPAKAKPVKVAQGQKPRQSSDDDETPAKSGRMGGQVVEKPAIAAGSVKIPQSEPALEHRGWFRTALSIN